MTALPPYLQPLGADAGALAGVTPDQIIREPLRAADVLLQAALSSSPASRAETLRSVRWGVSRAVGVLMRDAAIVARVPSLNSKSPDELPRNSLVRFRCMVQEQFDPECYDGLLLLRTAQGEERVVPGKFQDALQLPQDVEIVDRVRADRLPLFCVSVPGENEWVSTTLTQKDAAQAPPQGVLPTTSAAPSPARLNKKRSLDHDDDTAMQGASQMVDVDDEVAPASSSSSSSASPDKRARKATTDADGDDEMSSAGSASMPSARVLDENGMPTQHAQIEAIVRMYDDDANPASQKDPAKRLRLCDVIEVVAVLSRDPHLFMGPGGEEELVEDFSSVEEYRATHPPASRVHRLHCISYRRVDRTTGHLLVPPASTPTFQENLLQLFPSPSALESVRSSLLMYLSHVMLGDHAAAELLLLHLLSRTHSRKGIVPVGKFALNIRNCPPGVAELVDAVLRSILMRNRASQLTIANLNSAELMPKKNYDLTRLEPSWLQVAHGTHVLLDETVLTPGELNQAGLSNVRVLQKVISEQKLIYNFFYEAEYDVDIPVLILSRGKSIFKSDGVVTLQPTTETVPSGLPPVAPDLLERWRYYILMARQLPFELPEDFTGVLQGEMAAMRSRGESVSEEALHLRINGVRLLSASFLESNFSAARWEQMLPLVRRVELPDA